jgi:mannose-6-phosphate isomerase
MAEKLGPLKLEPFLSPRLWGGNRLADFLGLAESPLEPLGEAWVAYAGDRITNGPWAGRTLAEIAERCRAALVGTKSFARYGSKVPLLAKFIDAKDKLSIQVHPDDAYARRIEAASGFLGKTEAWYVIEAAPGASIIWGFKERLTRDELGRAAREGRLEPYLRMVPVQAGDVIYNPAGTVHAIGAGVFLFEIQQASDLTYRLYDYGRRDAEGKLRELHLDKALEVADLSAEKTPSKAPKWTPKRLSAAKTELIQVEHFAMARWQVDGKQTEATDPASLEILTVTGGNLRLEANGDALDLRRGEAVVLPAVLGRYTLSGRAALLCCSA